MDILDKIRAKQRPLSELIQVKVTHELKKQLIEYCKKNNVKPSHLMRYLISDFLEHHDRKET